MKLSEALPEGLPSTQALYTHFTDVRKLEEMEIYPTDESPPYPVDDAATHHVFDGGWIWVLPFNNGITSAGVAARDELAEELCFAEGAAAWERLLQRLPTVQEQFGAATAQLPFAHRRRLSFHSGAIVGGRWALLPSAAGFVDPLLSTGFPLTLLGVSRLAEAIERDWGTPRFESRLKKYAAKTNDELAATERLIAALYARMNDFPLFSSLSMLYFAAASFTETARRLDRPELAGGFLMHDHPIFGPRSRDCLERARERLAPREREELMEQIRLAVEPFDVAGLGDHSRRNWHPVKAEDLFGAAYKLGASREELENLLSSSIV
jgi:FADH2 O2-dependent halogenase